MLLHVSADVFDKEFLNFLQLGWNHIIDLKAYDHLLFIMTLCAVFTYSEWRKILVIVTAFTIGHSLTLILSSLDYLVFPQEMIEVLIPLTILITAIANVSQTRKPVKEKTFDKSVLVNYCIALSFGLIHGLGFANNFKFMMGGDSNIVKQLFAFNSGLESGQIVVVIALMTLMFILTRIFNIVHREWNLFISGAGAGLSIMMILNVVL